MVIAALGTMMVAAVSGIMSLGEVTPNPTSQNWLAAAHSNVEFKSWLFKTVLVVSANVLAGLPQLQCALVMVAAGWLAYTHVRWVRRRLWLMDWACEQTVCCSWMQEAY